MANCWLVGVVCQRRGQYTVAVFYLVPTSLRWSVPNSTLSDDRRHSTSTTAPVIPSLPFRHVQGNRRGMAPSCSRFSILSSSYRRQLTLQRRRHAGAFFPPRQRRQRSQDGPLANCRSLVVVCRRCTHACLFVLRLTPIDLRCTVHDASSSRSRWNPWVR